MGNSRSIQRQVAKGRLQAMNVGNVNRKMAIRQDGKEPLWRRVLFGDLSRRGFAAQQSQRVRKARKIRKLNKGTHKGAMIHE